MKKVICIPIFFTCLLGSVDVFALSARGAGAKCKLKRTKKGVFEVRVRNTRGSLAGKRLTKSQLRKKRARKEKMQTECFMQLTNMRIGGVK